MDVQLYDTQAQLLDRVLKEQRYGTSRAEVLENVVRDHAAYLATGGSPYENSGTHRVTVPTPEFEEARVDTLLEPVTGIALPVHAGEVLRVSQAGDGGQCVDFNAYNLHDYKEHLDCGFTRKRQPPRVTAGDLVWTGAPRGRPMFAILAIPDTCDVYLTGHRCNAVYFEREWGIVGHPSCQDTFAESIRAYGLTPDDVHDSYNLWMSTQFDERGKFAGYPPNPALPGDYVDFLAMFDTLSVPIVCGSSDLTGISNYKFSSVRVQVFAATASTMNVVDTVNSTWSSYASQRTPDDFRVGEVRAQRELELDPDYTPDFIPFPRSIDVEVEPSADTMTLIRALLERGEYGRTESEAVKFAFMRWFAANRQTDTYTGLSFEG